MTPIFPHALVGAAVWIAMCLPGVAQVPESVMVVEAHSGKVLVGAESVRKRPIASLTKIATGVVALDWAKAAGLEPEKIVAVVPTAASGLGGPNPMNLVPGHRLSLRDALYSALLGSDNVAALAVADAVGRGLIQRRGGGDDPIGVFVDEMNKLARALGMRDTKFSNPHGLIAERRHRSTAADMARLSMYAMSRPAFSFMVRQKQRSVTVRSAGAPVSYKVNNTNKLLGQAGVTGIKTGSTAAAGQCLATSVERDPLVRNLPDGRKSVMQRRLILVVLGSRDRFGQTKALIERGWVIFDRWVETGSPVQDARREILKIPNLP